METGKMKFIQAVPAVAAGVFLLAAVGLAVPFGFSRAPTLVSLVLAALSLAAFIALNRGLFKRVARQAGTVKALLNAGIFAVLLVVLVVVYLISATVTWQADLSQDQLYTLSDDTLKSLKRVTNEFRMILFKPLDNMDNSPMKPILDYEEKLIKAYAVRNPLVKYEAVDPTYNKAMALEYGIKEFGMAAFVYQGNRITLKANQLFDADKKDYRISFKGEEEFTSAVKSLVNSKPRNVYILTGHGEFPPDARGQSRYTEIMKRMKIDGINPQYLDLAKAPEIPQDCGVLIIGDPIYIIPPDELDRIKNYLNDGGNALVLLEFETHPLINDILKEMGLFALKNYVIDFDNYDMQRGNHVIRPDILPPNEAVMPLKLNNRFVEFPTAVGIQVLPDDQRRQDGGYMIFPLLESSKNSYGEVSEKEVLSGKMRQDARDLQGPLVVGYAVKKLRNSVKVTANSVETNVVESRMIVFGDSDFISDLNYFEGANTDLFINSLNYLLKREGYITIRPKTTQIDRFNLGSAMERFFQIMIFAPGALFLIPGIIIVVQRRRKVKI